MNGKNRLSCTSEYTWGTVSFWLESSDKVKIGLDAFMASAQISLAANCFVTTIAGTYGDNIVAHDPVIVEAPIFADVRGQTITGNMKVKINRRGVDRGNVMTELQRRVIKPFETAVTMALNPEAVALAAAMAEFSGTASGRPGKSTFSRLPGRSGLNLLDLDMLGIDLEDEPAGYRGMGRFFD
jgi:hypothetical protein